MIQPARIRVDVRGFTDAAQSRRSIVVRGLDCTYAVQVDVHHLDGDRLRVRVSDVRKQEGAAIVNLPGPGGRAIVVRLDNLLDDDATPGWVLVAALVAVVCAVGGLVGMALR